MPLPALTDKDRADLLFGIEQDIDFVAALFCPHADDVRAVRDFCRATAAGEIRVVAKIENADAVRNIDEIIEVSDAVMVARGDLGGRGSRMADPPYSEEDNPHVQP